MNWTVSFRNDLPLQILEDYDTGELKFNQTIELPYTEHEAACENQMGVINRWLERLTKAKAGLNTQWPQYRVAVADLNEAHLCYEYELRELDHLVLHHRAQDNLAGAKRVHFIYYDHGDRAGMCETCDKIDAANVKRYN